MKYIFLFFILWAVSPILGQSNDQGRKDTTAANPNYDKILADSLGGDDCGMKNYFLVILKRGANESTDRKLIGDSFRDINKLVAGE